MTTDRANSPNRDTEALIRPGVAARRLGVSVRTLQRMDNSGQITAIRREGGYRRYRAADVERIRAASTPSRNVRTPETGTTPNK